MQIELLKKTTEKDATGPTGRFTYEEQDPALYVTISNLRFNKITLASNVANQPIKTGLFTTSTSVPLGKYFRTGDGIIYQTTGLSQTMGLFNRYEFAQKALDHDNSTS